MQKIFLPQLAALLLMLPLPAPALCLLCNCSVAATPVAFGTYDPMSALPSNSDGSVRLTCGGLVGGVVSFDVALGKGLASSTFNPRKMSSGANLLNYDLYTSSAYSTVWGDGTGGSQTISGSVTILVLGGTTRDLVVYGRIPGSQTGVRVGSYSDALLVTVTYD